MFRVVFLVCICALASGCVTIRKHGEVETEQQLQWKPAADSTQEKANRDMHGCLASAELARRGHLRQVDADGSYMRAFNHCMQSHGHTLIEVTVPVAQK